MQGYFTKLTYPCYSEAAGPECLFIRTGTPAIVDKLTEPPTPMHNILKEAVASLPAEFTTIREKHTPSGQEKIGIAVPNASMSKKWS